MSLKIQDLLLCNHGTALKKSSKNSLMSSKTDSGLLQIIFICLFSLFTFFWLWIGCTSDLLCRWGRTHICDLSPPSFQMLGLKVHVIMLSFYNNGDGTQGFCIISKYSTKLPLVSTIVLFSKFSFRFKGKILYVWCTTNICITSLKINKPEITTVVWSTTILQSWICVFWTSYPSRRT